MIGSTTTAARAVRRPTARLAMPLVAAALMAALLLAAAPAAAQGDVKASLELNATEARNQFAWTIVAAPPAPTFVALSANGSGAGSATVAYSVTYQRRLLSTQLRLKGRATFDNRSLRDVLVRGGVITVCNGYFEGTGGSGGGGGGGGNATAAAGSSPGGCSGTSATVDLAVRSGFGALIPAGKRAAVPFEGAVVINRVSGPGVRGWGVAGPYATTYLDAELATGARVVTSPARVAFEIERDLSGDFGATASAFDTFVDAPVAVLTARPSDVASGLKIPDGLGMRIADTSTFNYTAVFKYAPGMPCGVPLTAVNEARLIVDNPGDAPGPEPQRTAVTVVAGGCARVSEARVARAAPEADVRFTWGLAKTANATELRLKRGETGRVRYVISAVRSPAKGARYAVSGLVLVSPEGGALGTKPLAVRSALVRLSSGDSGPARCAAPTPDGATPCAFERVPFRTAGLAPDAGTATATVLLANGSALVTPPLNFDFTAVALDAFNGSQAALTDTVDENAFDFSKSGLKLSWDNNRKLPSVRSAADVPLLIDQSMDFPYTIAITPTKCGTYRLNNFARLRPLKSAQAPLTASHNLTVVVTGC